MYKISSFQVDITPAITPNELDACRLLYLMDIDRSSNTVYGLEVNLVNRKINVVWSGNIGLQPHDKVISVKGKPYNRREMKSGCILKMFFFFREGTFTREGSYDSRRSIQVC